jgi:uncharacterized hydantoinase/oxoprolinase family protein
MESGTALTTTAELIDFYDATTGLGRDELERAIPAAIDALYTNRDSDGNMHSAGAAAAVAALEARRDG